MVLYVETMDFGTDVTYVTDTQCPAMQWLNRCPLAARDVSLNYDKTVCASCVPRCCGDRVLRHELHQRQVAVRQDHQDQHSTMVCSFS